MHDHEGEKPVRYTSAPLPPYRYLPGRAPHPRRDPAGHSYGEPEPVAPRWHPLDWNTLEPWLRAVDLFNAGYWWEAHEQLEALWKAAGKTTREARFVRGVLHIAAAVLHRELGREPSSLKQGNAGLHALENAELELGERHYMGIDVSQWMEQVRLWLDARARSAPEIILEADSEKAAARGPCSKT